MDLESTKARPRLSISYETLDYILTKERWKNTVKNCESNAYANMASDHFPLIVTVRIKLKAIQSTMKHKQKFEKCSVQTMYDFNKRLKQRWAQCDTIGSQTVATTATELAKSVLPQTKAKNNKRGIFDECWNLLKSGGKKCSVKTLTKQKKLTSSYSGKGGTKNGYQH